MRRFSSDPAAGNLVTSAHPSSHTAVHGNDGVAGVYTPPINRTASPMQPPPLDPVVLNGFRDETPATARLLSAPVAEEIRIMVPERLRIEEDWNLVYSLDQDGASLATLYEKCGAYTGKRGGFVLVVRDDEGGVSNIQPVPKRHPSLHAHVSLISCHIDIWGLPFRSAAYIAALLWHWRVLPVARLPHGQPATSAVSRHHRFGRPLHHYRSLDAVTHPRPGGHSPRGHVTIDANPGSLRGCRIGPPCPPFPSSPSATAAAALAVDPLQGLSIQRRQ